MSRAVIPCPRYARVTKKHTSDQTFSPGFSATPPKSRYVGRGAIEHHATGFLSRYPMMPTGTPCLTLRVKAALRLTPSVLFASAGVARQPCTSSFLARRDSQRASPDRLADRDQLPERRASVVCRPLALQSPCVRELPAESLLSSCVSPLAQTPIAYLICACGSVLIVVRDSAPKPVRSGGCGTIQPSALLYFPSGGPRENPRNRRPDL